MRPAEAKNTAAENPSNTTAVALSTFKVQWNSKQPRRTFLSDINMLKSVLKFSTRKTLKSASITSDELFNLKII